MNALLIALLADYYFGLSYSLVSPYLPVSPEGWLIGLALLAMGGRAVRLVLFPPRVAWGRVTATGILPTGATREIAFTAVSNLSASLGGSGEVRLAYGESDEKVASLGSGELVKMARSPLNHWVVDVKEQTVTMTRQEPGEDIGLLVEYPRVGKFAPPLDKEHVSFFIFIVALGFISRVSFPPALSILVFAFLFLVFIMQYFPDVTVDVGTHGVMLHDWNSRDHLLRYADVAKVEKGRLQVKVTARDGTVFRFPRVYYLLPELIYEMAGLAGSGTGNG